MAAALFHKVGRNEGTGVRRRQFAGSGWSSNLFLGLLAVRLHEVRGHAWNLEGLGAVWDPRKRLSLSLLLLNVRVHDRHITVG